MYDLRKDRDERLEEVDCGRPGSESVQSWVAPFWTPHYFHGRLLIAACGLYYLKFKVIRPAELWGDGKSVRKRRIGSRASTGADASRKRAKQDGQDDEAATVTPELVEALAEAEVLGTSVF